MKARSSFFGAFGKIAKAASTLAKGEPSTRTLFVVAMAALFEVG
jgi:hypothetical protein